MNPEEAARQRNARLANEGFDIPSAAVGFQAPDGTVVGDEAAAPTVPAMSQAPPAAPAASIPQMQSRLSQWAGDEARRATMETLNLDQIPGPTGELANGAITVAKLSEAEAKAAVLYDPTLNLANEKGEDGLIYKAICKTGTLALSPGPGQIDVEQPLQLTSELFQQIKESVDEQAFPYVTIPQTHGNGMLENTGYVRNVEVRPSTNPKDPPGTEVLWAGLDFTEPEIKDKVLRGTIPDTSIGVKFNYRNKRTGKTYPAALEHVALTHQPWVDGLEPFGQDRLLSQESLDSKPDEKDFLGVFTKDAPINKKRSGDILPSRKSAGELPRKLNASQRTRKRMAPRNSKIPQRRTRRSASRPTPRPAPTKQAVPDSVEELLASQQAQIDKLTAQTRRQQRELSLAQGTANSSASALHLAQVDAKAQKWQHEDGVAPALVEYAREVLLAYGPNDGGEAILTLSIESDGEVKEKKLSLDQIISTMIEKSPKVEIENPHVGAAVKQLHASQTPDAEDTRSDRERAEAAYDKAKKIREGGQQ